MLIWKSILDLVFASQHSSDDCLLKMKNVTIIDRNANICHWANFEMALQG